MDADVKAKWVEALRSGKYLQTQGVLRDASDRHCCLGVLCDITDPADWIWLEDENGAPREGWAYRHGKGTDTDILPGLLGEELGLDTFYEERLTEMNDNGKSFDEIADYIEKNL